MDETDEMAMVSKNQKYLSEDSSTVFRIAWYQIASKPHVLLEEYSEAESQLFQGSAKFSMKDCPPHSLRVFSIWLLDLIG